MMAAAKSDMNVTIISMNLDILEQQRGHMHHAVDQYVDTMIDAGRQWVTRGERNQSTFLEIHKIISKTIAFLSMQFDEIKSKLESETSDVIGRDEFTQQHKNAQMDAAGKPATTLGKGNEDETAYVQKPHTFTNPNLESDQQARYQDVYNQRKSVLAKQDKLKVQLNTALNNLREETEILKSEVETFNQYVETGKALLKDYSQKLESLENTVSCLSGNVSEMNLDQQILVDCINSHMSDKNDQVITDLSANVDQITTDLTEKIDQVNKALSVKVGDINTDLSAKVDQITTDLTDKIDKVNKEQSAKVGHINTEMTDKVDQVKKDLSAEVGLINEELSDKVDKINTDLAGKVEQINTDLSVKIDQINVVLQSLTNSEKEHVAQINRIIYLEKHFNTIEKVTQNNEKQVQQRLDEMGGNIVAVTDKLTVIFTKLANCAQKRASVNCLPS